MKVMNGLISIKTNGTPNEGEKVECLLAGAAS